MKFTIENEGFMNYRATPEWIDTCHHGDDCFIGSFQVLKRHTKQTAWCDLYVFNNASQQEVCIRTGNDGGDYISPGSIDDFMRHGSHHRGYDEYREALELLTKLGRFTWAPHPGIIYG